MKSTLKNLSSEIAALGTVSLTLLLFVISIPVLLVTQTHHKKTSESVAPSNA